MKTPGGGPGCSQPPQPHPTGFAAGSGPSEVLAQQALLRAEEQTQDVADAARDGDLTQRVPLDDKQGAIRELCDGVNALLDTMAAVVARIQRATGAIHTAAGEIAAGNLDLSQRTEEQAASLEETAS